MLQEFQGGQFHRSGRSRAVSPSGHLGDRRLNNDCGIRYLKTTLFGLTGCSPDYVMLIVGGNAGLIGMSKVGAARPLLNTVLALNVPFQP